MPRAARYYLTAPLHRRHWKALRGLPGRVRHPIGFLARYLLGRGSYPARIQVRTAGGWLPLEVYSPADVATVNEIFCRGDYEVAAPLRTVLDIGANIGISASYFLTLDPAAHVWCYEPAPQNIPRLRHQLARFSGRVDIREAAVGLEDGPVEFGVEATGRYGSIRIPETYERITVRCVSINTVLEEILSEVDVIDLVKLDTEGFERRTVEAIRPDLAARIGTIVFEWGEPVQIHPELFDASFNGATNQLVRIDQSAQAPSHLHDDVEGVNAHAR